MSVKNSEWVQTMMLKDVKQALENQQQSIENLVKINKILLLRMEKLDAKLTFLEENAHG